MKPYIETEVQGPGRRYWFTKVSACRDWAAAKQRAGYAVVWDRGSRTCWASFGKRRTPAVDAVVRGGIDPWAATPWSGR